MKCVIDRSKWMRGNYISKEVGWKNNEISSLCSRKTEKMCCLGFLGEACGIAKDDLQRADYPSDLQKAHIMPQGLFAPSNWWHGEKYSPINSNVEHVLAAINDSADVGEEVREAWIAEGFKQLLGVDVEFIG